MGKASRKKQSAAQAGRQESEQAAKPTSPRPGDHASRQALHLVIILVVGFLAYSNTFQSPFQWDEADFITGNPIVRDMGFFAEPSKAVGLPAYDALKSRYIGYLTFALNYKLHGASVFGYHIVNLAIHLINALLVYFLVLLTFRTPYFKSEKLAVSSEKAEVRNDSPASGIPSLLTTHDSLLTTDYSHLFAFAVAMLFVAHPVQTEAVTYVFQRLASLVSMFYLMSLVLYIKGRLSVISSQQSKGHSRFTIIWYLLSLLCAVLAMKTKENAFTLPVIITLYEFLFFSDSLKARFLRLLPFLLTMLIIPLTIMSLESTAGEIISQVKDPESFGYQNLSRNAYFLTQFRVIVTYIRLLFFPVNQNIDYAYPINNSFFEPPVVFSFLFLAAIAGFGMYLIYRSRQADKLTSQQTIHDSRFTIHGLRLIGFGILWFFITLSVESSIIPIPMVIDEYRAYLPSVGFLLAVMAGAMLIIKRPGGNSLIKERVAIAAFMALAVIFASATYARNTLWKDKVSLWEDVVAKSPASPRGYNNLGIAYNEKGMNEKAISMYERCIELSPFQKDVHINLGVAYALAGQNEKAIGEFTKAIAITPGNGVIYSNLARLYAQTGRFDKAAETYTKAIELDPYSSVSYHGLGTCYMRLGRVDDALGAYTKFVSLSPNDPEAYRNRAAAFAQKGDLKSAREDFQKACSLGNSQACESLERLR
jgi:protein O-mannosyl-transferase